MPKQSPDEQHALAETAWSARMAESVIQRHQPLGPSAARWHYEHGFVLKAIEQVWQETGEARYWRFIHDYVDALVEPGGDIRTYRLEEYNLDQVNPGKMLLPLYRAAGDLRYKKALDLLRTQLQNQPRTRAGGFWHKQIYPYQIWLDGLYMAAPFYAEYARSFDQPAGFDDVVQQMVLIESRARDSKTGLLYHAWDESRQQRWAHPDTGCSPHFWGRAMGWYAMALVDVLDYLPDDHPGRAALTAILQRVAEAVVRVQDQATGLWHQVLDQGGRPGNYLEASASCMFIYALAKGVRKACLAPGLMAAARKGYSGALERFIAVDDRGWVNLNGTCSVAGLGGTPYRDGSFEYYVGEPVATNDYKGVGAFILAAVEIEKSLRQEDYGRQ